MKAVTLLLLSLLTGCVSFNSNIDRSAMPEFTRLLVVSKLSNMRPDYLTNFLNTLPSRYEVCVLEAGPLVFGNPDSLINNQLALCKSQAILTISQYRNYTTGYGEYIRSTNEVLLEMTDAVTRKSFWKAIAQASGGNVPSADQIAKRLRSDGIVTGNLPYGKETSSAN